MSSSPMLRKLFKITRTSYHLSVVLNMLNKKFFFDQIAKATGFSVPEVERMAAEHSLT